MICQTCQEVDCECEPKFVEPAKKESPVAHVCDCQVCTDVAPNRCKFALSADYAYHRFWDQADTEGMKQMKIILGVKAE